MAILALKHAVSASWLLAALLCVAAAPVVAQDAATLRAKQTTLAEPLANNPFGRPLVIESTENSGNLKGDVYAVATQPFSVAGPALQGMGHWCDILMLHLNVKHCSWRGTGNDSVLSLSVGRKFDQPLEDTHKVDFSYRVLASTADYLQVKLSADDGPLGTRDYRIVLEAIPLDERSSFIHMSYSYGYGVAARLAMQSYLGTLGRDKVGFSIVERRADGSPVYVGGVRGVVERNAMRYYLAIDAFLNASVLPRAQQAERRISEWITTTERYARQLHEMDRDEYVAMKRKELVRQQASVGQ